MNLELDTGTWLIITLVALGISLWIIYELIKSASRGQSIYEEAQKQTKLLTEIARKHKVEESIIIEILDEPDSYSGPQEDF